MKQILIFLMLMFASQTHGQTTADIIYKLDKTSFQAIVDEIGETDIIYFSPKDTKRQQRISRSQVWKILYGSGETELVNNLTSTDVLTKETKVEVAEKDRIFLKNKNMLTGYIIKSSNQKIEYRRGESGPLYELDKKDVVKIVYGDGKLENFGEIKADAGIGDVGSKVSEQRKLAELAVKSPDFTRKMSATAGIDANYFLGSKDWKDKEDGFGFLTSFGGSVRLHYKISPLFGTYLTAGYGRASVEKNFLDGDVTLYKETYSLAGANAGLGLKYFINGSIYILGEGKANFMKLKATFTEDGQKESEHLSKVCPSFAAGIGITKEIGQVILEADIRYQLLQSSFKDVSSGPIHLPGIRIGIGFAKLFRK